MADEEMGHEEAAIARLFGEGAVKHGDELMFQGQCYVIVDDRDIHPPINLFGGRDVICEGRRYGRSGLLDYRPINLLDMFAPEEQLIYKFEEPRLATFTSTRPLTKRQRRRLKGKK